MKTLPRPLEFSVETFEMHDYTKDRADIRDIFASMRMLTELEFNMYCTELAQIGMSRHDKDFLLETPCIRVGILKTRFRMNYYYIVFHYKGKVQLGMLAEAVNEMSEQNAKRFNKNIQYVCNVFNPL